MTTLIAFAYSGDMVLCADKRITHDNRLLADNAQKIIFRSDDGKFAIAAAGAWGAITTISSLLIDHKDDMPTPTSQYGATKFAFWLRGLLLDNDLRPDVDPSEKDYTIGCLPCEFLVATSEQAITITAGMDVYTNQRIATLGSGAHFASGALIALMKKTTLEEYEVANSVFEIVSSLDTDTSAAFDMITINHITGIEG